MAPINAKGAMTCFRLRGRLRRHDGQGDEYGQHDEGDQQVSPQRDMADPTRHMALEPQPYKRLDELVGTKQRGDPRQRDELAAPADMADSIDADCAYQQAAADVRLRREAHAGSLSGWGVRWRGLWAGG
jgi:hypothetical protein